MILVQALGTGCAACDKLAQNVRRAVEELGIDARVEHVGDIDVIISLGVLAVPALAINGQVVVNGGVPSVSKIKHMLTVFDSIAAVEAGEAGPQHAAGTRSLTESRHGEPHAPLRR